MSPNQQDVVLDGQVLAALEELGVQRLAEPLLQETDKNRLFERVQAALQREDYEAAVEDAWLLAFDDPWNRDYAIAFATCLHQLGDYEAAARHYAIALLLDERDAYCAYRIGECLGALHHFPDARDAFESAVELSWTDPAFSGVRDHARMRLDELVALGN